MSFQQVYIEPANDEYGWFKGCRWLVIERSEHRVTGFKNIAGAKRYARDSYGVTRWTRQQTTRGFDALDSPAAK